jgi:hypothetical protein
LGYLALRQIHEEGPWISGRSALPNGSAPPASSDSAEMLPFAHIPTVATANKGNDLILYHSKNGVAILAGALTAHGTDFETGGAIP